MKNTLGVFLFLAVAGGGMLALYKLVLQNQDKRSSASYASAIFSVLPSTNNVNLGEPLVTQLVLNVGTGKTLNSVDIRVKYDKTKLSIDAASVVPLIRGGSGDATPSNRLFADAGGVLIKTVDSSAGTIRLSGVNLSSSELPTGVVYLFKLTFTTIAAGEGVRVELDSTYNNMALAEAVGVADKAYAFGTPEPGVYSIVPVADGSCVVANCTGTIPTNATRACVNNACSFTCNTGYVLDNGACVQETANCVVANCTGTIPTNATRACVNNACSFTCNTGYTLENGSCVQSVGPLIKLKVKLPKSEVPSGMNCPAAADIRVAVTALAKTTSGELVDKVYENILLTGQGSVANNYQIYEGQFVLTNFAPRAGVAFLIKGPKHLQVKYGKNNQNAYFQGDGEITVTEGDNTFDFSAYPLMAGDVATDNGWGQDLIVGGYDFTRVKEEVLKGRTGNLTADLDYNCVLNSLDLNLLKQTLNEKLGQTN